MNQIQAKLRFNISNTTRMTRLLPGKVSINVNLQVWLYPKSNEKSLFQDHHITTNQLLTAENLKHSWEKKLRNPVNIKETHRQAEINVGWPLTRTSFGLWSNYARVTKSQCLYWYFVWEPSACTFPCFYRAKHTKRELREVSLSFQSTCTSPSSCKTCEYSSISLRFSRTGSLANFPPWLLSWHAVLSLQRLGI